MTDLLKAVGVMLTSETLLDYSTGQHWFSLRVGSLTIIVVALFKMVLKVVLK